MQQVLLKVGLPSEFPAVHRKAFEPLKRETSLQSHFGIQAQVGLALEGAEIQSLAEPPRHGPGNRE